ncbi:PREDICTED: 60S ribosomal protein L10-like [Myotis davidii]|uniref:60S ribosomal protein L10-like n=1 Tax=Myotis davidii TaxID=225400 RepID=UPI000767B34F|nr:PREDICTED: 60S ribosomal protein L10-like [Myotis davidii]
MDSTKNFRNKRVHHTAGYAPGTLDTALSGGHSCLNSCCPQSSLQTGMQGAVGKPQGTAARAHNGQVIMSIRTKLQNKEHVIEVLHRAKFKFPGCQKIHISKKWGFTKFNADEFEDMVAEKRLIPDGCGVKYIPNRGPLDKWRALHS